MGWGHGYYTVTINVHHYHYYADICSKGRNSMHATNYSIIPWYTTTTTIDLVNVQANSYTRLKESTAIGQVEAACRRQQQQ